MDENEKIQMILRQTDFTEDLAREKLKEYNNDPILVIKSFLGILDKPKTVKSVNQEIYKQMRFKLDDSMRDYRIRKENEEP